MPNNELNATLYKPKGKYTNSEATKQRNDATRQIRINTLLAIPTCSRGKDVCRRKRFNGSPTGLCYQCWRKWGKSAIVSKRNSSNQNVDRSDMARLHFYTKRMGPKLAAFVEECIAQPESDQYNLSQELAIARDLMGEALELYEKAKLLPDSNPHKGSRIATAGALMASAMKEVRETCRVGSEAFNNAKDKYSVHTLVDVVSQIKKMIRNCFDHDQSGLQRFDQMLNDRLRLPKIGSDGTTITPDSDVMQMDDSVPRCIDTTATELLLLQCPQCNGQFNHPDLNCVCPECNVQLVELKEVA